MKELIIEKVRKKKSNIGVYIESKMYIHGSLTHRHKLWWYNRHLLIGVNPRHLIFLCCFIAVWNKKNSSSCEVHAIMMRERKVRDFQLFFYWYHLTEISSLFRIYYVLAITHYIQFLCSHKCQNDEAKMIDMLQKCFTSFLCRCRDSINE